ncbi:MAG: hypothetical protein Q3966_06710 [Neisseria sp.]|nr:hypothetical protein [Neisseria sp.]
MNQELGRHYGTARRRIFTLHTWIYLFAALILANILLPEFAKPNPNPHPNAWLLSALLAVWTVWLLADKLQSRIAFYHNGFIRHYPFGRQKTVFFHPEMHVFVRQWRYAFFLSLWKTAVRARIRLYLPDGGKFVLPATFCNIGLLNIIRQYQFIHTLPRLGGDFEGGRTVDFGGVKLNQTGIFVGQKFFSWHEYKPKLGSGRLSVYKIKPGGKTKWLPAANICLGKISEVNILLDFIGFARTDVKEYGVEEYSISPF